MIWRKLRKKREVYSEKIIEPLSLSTKGISVFKRKGGVGATLILANLALILAMDYDLDVALMDGDIMQPSLTLAFYNVFRDLPRFVLQHCTLLEYLADRCSSDDTVYRLNIRATNKTRHLVFIPSIPPRRYEGLLAKINIDKLEEKLIELSEKIKDVGGEYLLIDSPGIVEWVHGAEAERYQGLKKLYKLARQLILISDYDNAEMLTESIAYTIRMMPKHEKNFFVLTKVRESERSLRLVRDLIENVRKIMGSGIFLVVPYDETWSGDLKRTLTIPALFKYTTGARPESKALEAVEKFAQRFYEVIVEGYNPSKLEVITSINKLEEER